MSSASSSIFTNIINKSLYYHQQMIIFFLSIFLSRVSHAHIHVRVGEDFPAFFLVSPVRISSKKRGLARNFGKIPFAQPCFWQNSEQCFSDVCKGYCSSKRLKSALQSLPFSGCRTRMPSASATFTLESPSSTKSVSPGDIPPSCSMYSKISRAGLV